MSGPTTVMQVRRAWRRTRWWVMHPLRKLATLSIREWRYLLHAQLVLLWAQLLVWIRPLGGLVDSTPLAASGAAGGMAAPPPAAASGAHASGVGELPRQLALGVSRAAAYGVFRPLCLVRSVALSRLLDHYGVHGSRIRVGVRWVNGQFTAHAWVEYQGEVLGDDVAHVSGFADLSEVRVLKWS